MKAQIGLMIEGQFGLNWDRWRRILAMAERVGYQCVFRSDHFTNPAEPDLDSLELFTSLMFAATATSRIEFGSLVAPVTFRHPTMTVRQAAQIDDLSGGRLVLGLGAGLGRERGAQAVQRDAGGLEELDGRPIGGVDEAREQMLGADRPAPVVGLRLEGRVAQRDAERRGVRQRGRGRVLAVRVAGPVGRGQGRGGALGLEPELDEQLGGAAFRLADQGGEQVDRFDGGGTAVPGPRLGVLERPQLELDYYNRLLDRF